MEAVTENPPRLVLMTAERSKNFACTSELVYWAISIFVRHQISRALGHRKRADNTKRPHAGKAIITVMFPYIIVPRNDSFAHTCRAATVPSGSRTHGATLRSVAGNAHQESLRGELLCKRFRPDKDMLRWESLYSTKIFSHTPGQLNWSQTPVYLGICRGFASDDVSGSSFATRGHHMGSIYEMCAALGQGRSWVRSNPVFGRMITALRGVHQSNDSAKSSVRLGYWPETARQFRTRRVFFVNACEHRLECRGTGAEVSFASVLWKCP